MLCEGLSFIRKGVWTHSGLCRALQTVLPLSFMWIREETSADTTVSARALGLESGLVLDFSQYSLALAQSYMTPWLWIPHPLGGHKWGPSNSLCCDSFPSSSQKPQKLCLCYYTNNYKHTLCLLRKISFVEKVCLDYFIGVQLIYNVVLVSGIQQSESLTRISTPF